LNAVGRDALRPLLTALTTAEASQRIYRGAHHVLHDLAQRKPLRPLLLPVLKAFEHPEPELAIPNAAEKALHSVLD
jgi:hypothetical protein